jgi:hypothetical protein
MKDIKLLQNYSNNSLSVILYTNNLYNNNISSHPSFFNNSIRNFSTTISLRNQNNNDNKPKLNYIDSRTSMLNKIINNNNKIIKIDKSVWKTLIFPFNILDNGFNELKNNLIKDKNYVLLIQGSYRNQFISIGPKLFVNSKTPKSFLLKYFEYYSDLLASKNYNIEEINDIILRFRDTNIVKIIQPEIPNKEKLDFKPIIPKSFLFEKYFPASVYNDQFGEIISSSINSKGQEVFEFEYNSLNII